MTADQHVSRAADHERVAKSLHEASGEDWAAVAYFYSAYQLVSAALQNDPIFEEPSRLAEKNLHLTMADKTTARHQGYFKTEAGMRVRVWGLNDLTALLYPSIWGYYHQLHEGSVDVRYHAGLRVPLDKLAAAAALIKQTFGDGGLVCT